VIARTDAKSNSSAIAYDARNRVISLTDGIDAETTWTYDDNGNELSMTDAESQTTTYGHDDANRKTSITWPDHVAMTTPGDANHGITTVACLGGGVYKADCILWI
jgi:YD repeat-containing protein